MTYDLHRPDFQCAAHWALTDSCARERIISFLMSQDVATDCQSPAGGGNCAGAPGGAATCGQQAATASSGSHFLLDDCSRHDWQHATVATGSWAPPQAAGAADPANQTQGSVAAPQPCSAHDVAFGDAQNAGAGQSDTLHFHDGTTVHF